MIAIREEKLFAYFLERAAVAIGEAERSSSTLRSRSVSESSTSMILSLSSE